MASVSVSLGLPGTGVKTFVLRGTLVRIATRPVDARQKTISATQRWAVFANQGLTVRKINLFSIHRLLKSLPLTSTNFSVLFSTFTI